MICADGPVWLYMLPCNRKALPDPPGSSSNRAACPRRRHPCASRISARSSSSRRRKTWKSRPDVAPTAAYPSARRPVRYRTTSPTGWACPPRTKCARRGRSLRPPRPCPKSAVASARRTGCARAPAP